jgi:hypothetical protein
MARNGALQSTTIVTEPRPVFAIAEPGGLSCLVPALSPTSYTFTTGIRGHRMPRTET